MPGGGRVGSSRSGAARGTGAARGDASAYGNDGSGPASSIRTFRPSAVTPAMSPPVGRERA